VADTGNAPENAPILRGVLLRSTVAVHVIASRRCLAFSAGEYLYRPGNSPAVPRVFPPEGILNETSVIPTPAGGLNPACQFTPLPQVTADQRRKHRA
jgi:hypothetical protein